MNEKYAASLDRMKQVKAFLEEWRDEEVEYRRLESDSPDTIGREEAALEILLQELYTA